MHSQLYSIRKERKAMGVFSSPMSTRLTLKWVTLVAALLFVIHCSTPTVGAHLDTMDGEALQQQRRSCDPQRLSDCHDYLQRRREQPSERCCEELQRMSPHCRCRAIEQTLDQSLSFDSSTDSDSQDGAPLNQRRRRRGEGRGREEEEAADAAVKGAEGKKKKRRRWREPRSFPIDATSASHPTAAIFDATLAIPLSAVAPDRLTTTSIYINKDAAPTTPATYVVGFVGAHIGGSTTLPAVSSM